MIIPPSNIEDMKILRTGSKDAFKYTMGDGKEVRDKVILDYIKKLVIPPAYKDVVINYEKSPKILFVGVDSKDRIQRIYSPKWRIAQDKEKFCDLLLFSDKVRQIVADADSHLVNPTSPMTKEKIISIIIKLVMTCHFRIGNAKYKELYGSYGAMNLQVRHLTTHECKKGNAKGKEVMRAKFPGKKGVINQCEFSDEKLIGAIKNLIKDKKPTQSVFQYVSDGGHELQDVTAIEFNKYLDKYDPRLTSKMFRTWDSNMLFIIYMQNLGDPTKFTSAERKKNLIASYKFVSDKINNTPAILKKSYTQSGLNEIYTKTPKKYKAQFMNGDPRELFTMYLRKIC